MKKLLLIALLTVAMVFTLVACTEEKPPEETTGETTGVTSGESADETTAETPADTDSVNETDPPVEETDPPIEETDPPVEETDPPAKETDPPAKETDPPVEETDPPETEAPDPNQPTLLITADALTPGQGYWDMEAPILSEDGSYITITPSGNDPYYNPLGNPAYLEGDRYLVVKYRTDKGQDTSLQIYAGSGSLASDNDMLKTDIVSDGEWHLAIFDLMLIDGQTSDLTGASTAAGYYDGSTVAFLRLDAMEVNYILNDEGKPYKVPAPDGTTEIWARYDMPTDAYIDIAYLAFFSTEEGALVYEYGEPSKPTLVIGDETIELDLIENWDSVYGEPFMGWGSIASDGNGNVKINCDGTDILCVYGINGSLTNAESAAITGFEHIVFSIDTTNSTSDLQFIFQPEKEAGVNFTTGPVGSAYLIKEDGSIVEIAPNSYNRWGYNIPKGTKGTLILPYTTISNYDNGDTADVNENDLPAYGSAAEASITRLGFMIVPQNGQSGGDMIIGDVYVCGAIAALAPAPAEDLTIDMSTLSDQAGYQATWDAAGISTPHVVYNYGTTIDLGTIDLSKYSKVIISYCCDGGQGTADNFAAASSLAIGLKSENSSYGQETSDNFSGDIAHTDMVFSSNGWGAGIRGAEVDLTGVTYNGNVWVALHNPAGTQVAVTGIQFIA